MNKGLFLKNKALLSVNKALFLKNKALLSVNKALFLKNKGLFLKIMAYFFKIKLYVVLRKRLVLMKLGNLVEMFGQNDLLIAGRPAAMVGLTAKQASPHIMAASRKTRGF